MLNLGLVSSRPTVFENLDSKENRGPQGTSGWKPSPEQVIQEMPSALRLYLRSSSTWMLVSGRKSKGARLAGRSRLANTRDRMRMETKSPARKGCRTRKGWGPGDASRALAKSCSFYGAQRGEGPTRLGRGPVCQPVGKAC